MEYSEILKEMEDKYEELSGFCPGDGSDAGIRLRVLAGELHNLWTQMEWLERQIFPDTATGQWLEKLAEQKGLQRKAGARASGTLTFLRESPLWYDITIPKGTRCAVSRKSGVSYETLEEVVLPSGSLSVDAAAQAMSIGVEGNSPADTITVMLTPPAGISSVTNGTAFTGGVEEEDDESLRERLLEAYHRPSNGVNSGFYEQEALKHDQVYSDVYKRQISPPVKSHLFLENRIFLPNVEPLFQGNSPLSSVFLKKMLLPNFPGSPRLYPGYSHRPPVHALPSFFPTDKFPKGARNLSLNPG